MYMIVPIVIILISIIRTCVITINLKKRFRTSTSNNQQQQQHQHHHHQQQLIEVSTSLKLDTIVRCNSTIVKTRVSNSFVSSPSSTTATTNTNHSQLLSTSNRLANYNRRRSRMDGQMIILISINVAPFILVHIITEIAYLFEKYSAFVADSTVAKLIIILIYLSWYLISATRFYTNCLLSRIYREEFRNRLYMLRHGCKPRPPSTDRISSIRHSSRYFIGSMANVGESTTINLKSIAMK